MLTIHAVRTGDQILISQDEFTMLIQKVLEIQPVNVVEQAADDEMTEDDLQAYYEAKAEFERGEAINFDAVKGAWGQGEASVCKRKCVIRRKAWSSRLSGCKTWETT